MTTTAFVADVHVGNHRRFGGAVTRGINVRCREALDALADALFEAEEAGARRFVVLGDLFDTNRPSPQELYAVMELFKRFAALEVHLLVGNHDQSSSAPNDHALAPLSFLRNVTVHERPTQLDRLIIVPYQSGPASSWLPRVLEELEPAGEENALCLHLGIADASTPAFLRGSSDSIAVDELWPLMDRFGVTSTFAGNWHDARSWELLEDLQHARWIYQVGALAPTGFDNLGHRVGEMLLWDWAKPPRVLSASSRPRFLSGSFEDGFLETIKDSEEGSRPYVKVTARTAHLPAARAELVDLRSNGVIADFMLLPDREVVAAAASSAAKAARSASTIAEAVAGYVSKMPVEKGIDRHTVLERVKSYLG